MRRSTSVRRRSPTRGRHSHRPATTARRFGLLRQRLPHLSCACGGRMPTGGHVPVASAPLHLLFIYNRCRSLTRSACSSSCSGTAQVSAVYCGNFRVNGGNFRMRSSAVQPMAVLFVHIRCGLCSRLQECRIGARNSTQRTKRCARRMVYFRQTPSMPAARRMLRGAFCVLHVA